MRILRIEKSRGRVTQKCSSPGGDRQKKANDTQLNTPQNLAPTTDRALAAVRRLYRVGGDE